MVISMYQPFLKKQQKNVKHKTLFDTEHHNKADAPLTRSPLLKVISLSPWAEWEWVATNTLPGTAL